MTPPHLDPLSFAVGFVTCFCIVVFLVRLATRRPKP